MTITQRACDHWRASVWWRKESKISATPDVLLQYAEGLEALSCHMIANPRIYEDRGELTDWQIYQRNN